MEMFRREAENSVGSFTVTRRAIGNVKSDGMVMEWKSYIIS